LAKLTHPDVYQNHDEKLLAQLTFGRLVQWFDQAVEKIGSGRYGKAEQITLETRTRRYEVESTFIEDGDFNIYSCHYFENRHIRSGVLRVVRDPRKNHLSRSEVHTLNILRNSRDAAKLLPYIPLLLDEFFYESGTTSHHTVIFEQTKGWYSLEQVHTAYPNGIDPKDMAWMWRRLLVALGFAHANSVIHNSILPCNVWIQPEEHGLILRNWFHSTETSRTTGKNSLEINPKYAAWYPQEVLDFTPPTFGTDIKMSAKCMIYLLGGDAEQGKISNSIPNPMSMFLKGTTLPGNRTPQDAWALKHEFDDMLERLWGKRTFHPFTMNFTRN